MIEKIREHALKGMMWSGLSEGLSQLFRFVITLILARLLVPQDFGIIGMASIFIGILLTFNQLGLAAGIIQRKSLTSEHINASFWAGIAIGVFFCVFTLVVSSLVADFFQEERLGPVLSFLSLIFIIGALASIPRALLIRDLKFKQVSFSEIIAELIASVIAIVMALSGFGLWSLVWKNILGNLFITVIYWVIHPWRPALHFNYKSFKEIFGFSSNVMGSDIIGYAQSNVDYLIIGKMLGALQLGYYSLAFNMISFPVRRVSSVIGGVIFPVFSRIQDNNDKLRRGYLETIKYTSIITFPAIAGLFILAPEFVSVILGQKWSPAILPLQILCLLGVVRSITYYSGSVLLSKGKPDLAFRWNTLTLVMLVISISWAMQYGIVGVAATVAIVSTTMCLIIQLMANGLIDLKIKDFLWSVYPAFISSLAMVGVIWLFKQAYLVSSQNSFYIFIVLVPLGIVIYLITLKIVCPSILSDVKRILKEILNEV